MGCVMPFYAGGDCERPNADVRLVINLKTAKPGYWAIGTGNEVIEGDIELREHGSSQNYIISCQTIHNDKVGDRGRLAQTLSYGQGKVDIAKRLHSSTSESVRGCPFVEECSVYPELVEYGCEDDIGGTSSINEDPVYVIIWGID
ncbi:hypothetical protein L3X38_003445 [Prunus dulcis]|uniref:Uncharacterized protein n=1 Tax=Prunus dulcis TaxID=3755 RepID=A0AAD5F229_PRUDU|nr:hypothetical protein L3X38_003445 [Prunus dulcis]